MLRKLYLIVAVVPALALLCISATKESIKDRQRVTTSHNEHNLRNQGKLITHKAAAEDIGGTSSETESEP